MFINCFQPMDRHSTLWVNQAIAENHRVNAQTPKQYPGFTYFEPIKYQIPLFQWNNQPLVFSPFAGFNNNSGSNLWGGLFSNNFAGINQPTGTFLNFNNFSFGNQQPISGLWGGLVGNFGFVNYNTPSNFTTTSSKKAKENKTTSELNLPDANKNQKTKKAETKQTTAVSKPATPEPQKVSPKIPTADINHSTPAKNDFRKDFVTTARKYMGYNEADGSSRRISKSGEWCADFVKYVLDETYASKGLRTPSGLHKEWDMPHLRVENIKNWGIKKGMYLDIAHQSNKAEAIKRNVKVGDILILRENRASHTGFVTKVYPDGSFDTIEGNRGDKVATGHYSAYHKDISGFVQVA